MVSGIESNVSALQVLRATQAFKTAISSSQKAKEILNDVEDQATITSSDTESNKNVAKIVTPLNGKFVNEIKQYAQRYSGNEISEDDIKYALKYGRSVLVNHSV